ncbi:MAG: DNA cytosine methyltransferase [Romboutsia sp.]
MKKYTVIDLFSGCGGISQGFKETGKFEIVGGIEFDELASKTFKHNFPNSKAIHGDITKIDVKETSFEDVDVIVGGPPCQGFSALNRWNKDLEEDPRNKLFYDFLRFVSEIKPKAVLIENVRQILTSKDGYARKKICELLEDMGYNVCYSVLDSSDYGVPQNRKRAFFVGIRHDIGRFNFDNMRKFYQPKVTVEEALSDIYDIEEVAKNDINGYGYKLGSIKSEYQRIMRDGDELNNHFIYYPIQSVQDKMKFVPEGGNWKNVPPEMFKSQRNNRHSNYLKRLDSQSQSITIDTGHNVYFHPKFDRVPTVRESARIQSFPDGFTFLGNKGQQLRQVGNAVPPLLAKALASGILEVLDNEEI